MPPRDLDHARLTRSYECLRDAVLAQPRQSGSGHGEGLVVRRGLAAWLESHAAGTGTAPAPRFTDERREASPLPADVHEQLLSVLVNLVMGGSLPQESRP